MARECPGPNPATRPRLVAPAGACDTHIHVVDPCDRYPMVPERTSTSPEAPCEVMKDFLARPGGPRPCHGQRDRSGGHRRCHRGDERPGPGRRHSRYRGDEGRHGTDGQGGHPRRPGGRRDSQGACRQDRRSRRHMLFMPSDPEQWLQLAPLLGRLPVDAVVDHLAWRGWKAEDGLKPARLQGADGTSGHGRACMKLGGMYRYSREEARWRDLVPYARAVIGACPGRIIWGSDWRHVRTWDFPLPDDDKILDRLLELGLDDAMIVKILVDNPAALCGFGQATSGSRAPFFPAFVAEGYSGGVGWRRGCSREDAFTAPLGRRPRGLGTCRAPPRPLCFCHGRGHRVRHTPLHQAVDRLRLHRTAGGDAGRRACRVAHRQPRNQGRSSSNG